MRNYSKTQVFRNYCLVKIGEVISQAIWQNGKRIRLHRYERVGNMELFVVFDIIINSSIAFFNGFISLWLKFYFYFRVWFDEPKGNEGAGGRVQP